MQKRLVLLLVFVCIVFLWFNRSSITEGFKAGMNIAEKPIPLTVTDVKEIFDEFILSNVKEYQTLADLKSDDPRAINLMKVLADDINSMNSSYPSFQENIKTFPYESFPMISKKDLLLVKDSLIRTVGQVDSKKPLEAATKPDIDIYTARLQAFQLFMNNKFNLLPRETRDALETIIMTVNQTMNDSLKYADELKKTIGSTSPLKIPVLKRMIYLHMILYSAGNFVWPSEIQSKPTGPIQTDNLPIPKTGITGLTNALQEQTTPTPSGAAPICPPPPEPCPIPPEGKKYSETVRDLLIENALVKAYGGTYLY